MRLALFMAGVVGAAAGAAPRVPADVGEVLASAPLGGGRVRGSLAAGVARFREAPSPRLAAELAGAFLARYREAGDPAALRYARRALAPYRDTEKIPGELALIRAKVDRAAQRFEPALRDLTALVAAAPGDPRPWLELAAIQEEQGDYRAAFSRCLPLVGMRPSYLATLCLCRVNRYGSAAAAAAASLEAALTGAGASAPTPEHRRQIRLTLAEIARDRGDDAAAAAHLAAALEARPGHVESLRNLAEFRLATGRVRGLEDTLAGSPPAPGLLLVRALAARARGDRPGADRWARLLRAQVAAARREGRPELLELEARFALEFEGDADRALDLAAYAWRFRRSPAAGRVFLEAARAAGQADAAAPVHRWAAAAGVTLGWFRRLADAVRAAEGPAG